MSRPDQAPGSAQAAQWRRWQMGELDSRGQVAADPGERRRQAERQRAQQRRAEFESLRRQELERAREEGYQQGLAAGREAGHAEGLEQGRAEGLAEYRDRAETALAPMSALLQTFHDALQELDDSVADELVELALETGRQLAGEALDAHPEEVTRLVRKLLHDEPLLNGEPRLWLHPEDLALVSEELGEEFKSAGWVLQPDDELTRGGCRVTCPSGELDATRETRWQAVMSRVRRPRSRQQPSGEAS